MVYLSNEAVSMFRAIALESTDLGDEKGTKPFRNYAQAFLVAATIGILSEKKLIPNEKKHWLFRGEYLVHAKSYNPVKQLLKAKYGLKTDREVIELLIAYAEAGVRELFDEYKTIGDINFLSLSRRYS